VPIILFIEDIHWADSASLALLHYVARAASSEKILILATFRSEELTADAEGHPHPLTEAMRMMRREDLFTEIKLPSLDQANITKIAENMMGGRLQPTLAEKLASESRGNPLFIVESLRMLNERRSLIQENNKWRLAVDELGIPTKIKDIILRRLAVLKYTQRRVLDAASVIGEKFDVELLSVVLELDNLEVLETLNVVAHSTSLVSVEENCYRFDHARSRETLYDELSPPLKRGYHGKIAEKLESAKSTTLPLSDLAYHYDRAGNKEKSLKYALAAAKDELARFSNQQAINHFTYVLQNIPNGPGSAEQKRAAMEGLGDAYAANLMYAEAIKTFDELAASETGLVRLRAIRKAMDAAYLKGGSSEMLLEYARKAEELAEYDCLEMARVLDNRGRAFGYSGRGDAKMDLADYNAALQIFEEENSLADAAEALWRSGVVSTFTADLRFKGLAELLRSVAIFKELGDVRKEVEATYYLGQGFGISALVPEAIAEYKKVLQIGEKLGNFYELSQACSALAEIDHTKKVEESIALNLKALEYCKKTDLQLVEAKVYGNLVGLYSMKGDLKKAKDYDAAISKMPPEYPVHLYAETPILMGRNLLSWAEKQWKITLDLPGIEKNISKDFLNMPGFVFGLKLGYAWVLEKQGKLEEAKIQAGEATKVLEEAEQKFLHANVDANLMMQRSVQVGEEFEMRLDLVNVARTPALLTRIEGLVPQECDVVSLPPFCSLRNDMINLNGKTVNPFTVETIRLKLKATKAGKFTLNPSITYADDQGKTKTAQPAQITLTVHTPKPAFEVQSGRMTIGYAALDGLLLGGIPEKYAVVLSAPSCDEREMLVNHYLRTGVEASETTFYISSEAANTKALAEEHPSNFYLIVCNPQADVMIQNLPNVYKLKGLENLTEIDIALTKAFRTLNPSAVGTKRICLEIVSDALLQHHALNTRRWLSALLPTLKLKGFTILAVVDPSMHPSEELQAVLGLFDGEISIYEKETGKGSARFLKVKRLSNQKYSKDEAILT
jgi:tetratricopeptide (TPR) repeat protein/KaiC/GvpD/RAD55 family RecA-like ATPase